MLRLLFSCVRSVISEVTKFFFFVTVFNLVFTCPLITLIKCLIGHPSLVRFLDMSVSLNVFVYVDQVMSAHHSDQMSQES